MLPNPVITSCDDTRGRGSDREASPVLEGMCGEKETQGQTQRQERQTHTPKEEQRRDVSTAAATGGAPSGICIDTAGVDIYTNAECVSMNAHTRKRSRDSHENEVRYRRRP